MSIIRLAGRNSSAERVFTHTKGIKKSCLGHQYRRNLRYCPLHSVPTFTLSNFQLCAFSHSSYVVDSGMVKSKLFDSKVGMDVLAVVPISLAQAKQRFIFRISSSVSLSGLVVLVASPPAVAIDFTQRKLTSLSHPLLSLKSFEFHYHKLFWRLKCIPDHFCPSVLLSLTFSLLESRTF